MFDTSAILSGKYDILSAGAFVTDSALSEIRKGKISRHLGYLEGNIHVKSPTAKAVDAVKSEARRTGDIDRLSQTDIDVIALSLELGAILVTDDFSIQNVAATMGIEVHGANLNDIGKEIEWTFRCTGCGRFFGKRISECPVCGHPVKNFPRRIRKRK